MPTRSQFLPDAVPLIARAGSGPMVRPFRCDTARIVVPANATDGAYAILERVSQPGFSPPRHIHRREDEIIHLLAGEVLVWCDGTSTALRPGDTATLPRGLPHSFRVMGIAPARMLLTIVPGGFERFFAAVATLELPNDIPDLLDLGEAFGIDYVGPPLAEADLQFRRGIRD